MAEGHCTPVGPEHEHGVHPEGGWMLPPPARTPVVDVGQVGGVPIASTNWPGPVQPGGAAATHDWPAAQPRPESFPPPSGAPESFPPSGPASMAPPEPPGSG